MKLQIYQVDAFASVPFHGNPAAVCILDKWLPDMIMKAIAAELNQSETAFVVKREDGDFRIRWFTPTTEVALCGHATLASAHILYAEYGQARGPIRFHSRSGILIADEDDNGISLDFPSNTMKPCELSTAMVKALGGTPVEAHRSEKHLTLVYSDASEVEILSPSIAAIKELPFDSVSATALGNGNGYDFVCRMFAPNIGIDEDPVTGSLFTRLAPFYALRTGKMEFLARQVSKRGGDVYLSIQGDRVFIAGSSITVFAGELYLPSMV